MDQPNKENANELAIARAKIEEEKVKRESQALQEINEVLIRYDCEMQAQALIAGDGRIVARAVVTAKV